MNPWHHVVIAKRSGQKRDFTQVAREVVEQAIVEQMDGSQSRLQPQIPEIRTP
jgi:hypothetical protein